MHIGVSLGIGSEFSPRSGGGGGGGGIFVIPPELRIPDPLVWHTASAVETDVSGNITKILNQGSLGSAHDAVPLTASLAKVANPAGWNGRNVFEIPETANGGYNSGAAAGVQSLMTIATYQNGLQATFTNFDALVSGQPSQTSHEIIGSQGSASLIGKSGRKTYHNGVTGGFGVGPAILPMDKETIGLTDTNNSPVPSSGYLWADNSGTDRNWWGLMGDIMYFGVVLTDAQMLGLHNALLEFYTVDVPE